MPRPMPPGRTLVRRVLLLPLLALFACQSQGEVPRPGSAAPPAAPSPEAAAVPSGAPADASTAWQPKPAIEIAKLIEAITQKQQLAADATVPAPKTVDPDLHPGLSSTTAGGAGIDFPLMHTEVRAEVTGTIARVELTQLYQNPTTDRLEAIYKFPLPTNAAVTEMYFRIGNRVIWGEVKKRAEAKATYEAAKREGHTAALTEQERPNLFTQSVANIPPGQTIAVVLRYVHEVPFDDGRYSFVFPTTVGPRYIPGDPTSPEAEGRSPDTTQVADASRITPPVLAGHGAHDVDILVKLNPGAAFGELASRNHRIVTGLDGNGSRVVALAEDDRIPNKDFVLAYRPVGARPEAHVIVQREKGDDYLMLFLQPPRVVSDEDVRPRELVFLIDKSGSMMGEPIETAKALIRQTLKRMGPHDTFELVAFDSGVYQMSSQPLANTAENVKAADGWLESLQGGGGTEMLSGILAALTPATDPSRLRMVIFCTDGFIGNEDAIVKAVGERRGDAHVFGFGIGSSVNRFLIEGVGRAGRGASEVVGLKDDVEEAVARLYRRLDRPLLSDLSVHFDGLVVSELSPEALPDLFAGQPLVLVGKYARGTGPAPTVTLSGKLGARPWSKTLPIELAQEESAPVLGTLWARRRIEELSFRSAYQPGAQEVEAITDLGLRFHLITPYTSLVAVERELKVDPGLPLTQVLVPSELPDGVDARGIFGESGGAEAEILPGRVKPGDPELRVHAESTSQVFVQLPFEDGEREAAFDSQSGDFVLRFLVPPAWPDGSYQARVRIARADGTVDTRELPLRVDTTAAQLAVLGAPTHVSPGQAFALQLKPSLPVAQLARALVSPGIGGRIPSLTGAMDVKEVLVRAPWGEIVRARLEGPLGIYTAQLHVPDEQTSGSVSLELVASDAAGNVSRRGFELEVVPVGAVNPWAVLATVFLVASLAAMAWGRAVRGRAPVPVRA